MADETLERDLSADASEMPAPPVDPNEFEDDEPEDLQTFADDDEGEEIEGAEPGDDDLEELSEPEPEGPALAEIEFDGKSYQVPEELKGAFMMERDYRQKTQTLAEQRREVERQQKHIEQIATMTKEEMDARIGYERVNRELQQFQSVNWDRLEAEDPMGAQQAFRKFQMLQGEAQQHAQAYATAQQQRSQIQSQELQERIASTRKFAEKNIPGWTPEIDQKVTEFAAQFFPEEQLAQAITPDVYRVLHYAWLGAQSMERAKAKPKAAKQQGQAIRPLQKVQGRSPANTGRVEDIDDINAYAAARRKDLAAMR